MLIGSIAIEASHLNIIRCAYCITSSGHIIISVSIIPSCQFCIIACANYTIISGKRNIMGRLVPSHTCLRVAKLNQNQSIYIYRSRVRDFGLIYFPVLVYGFFVTTSPFYLSCFSDSRSSSGSTLSIRPSIHPSVRQSATLYGYQVCVICNSKSFHSFLFKLCLMIVHI